MAKPLVIFGSAEIASLAKYYFENDAEREVCCFSVDDDFLDNDSFEGVPLVPFSELARRYPPDEFDAHVALSYVRLNNLRQQKYEQMKAAGYSMASYVCSKSVIWPDAIIGDNCLILENQTIQPNVTIGNNVMLWSGNHIGHGSRIEDHAYLASHVVVSGHCVIGERSFLGVNVTLKDFCNVGSDCFVAMGADVTVDMADGSVALGQSANVFDADDRRSKAVKKKFFKI